MPLSNTAGIWIRLQLFMQFIVVDGMFDTIKNILDIVFVHMYLYIM